MTTDSTTLTPHDQSGIQQREIITLIMPEIRELIEDGQTDQIQAALEDWHTVDLAVLLESLKEPEHRLLFFRVWDMETGAELFDELDDEAKAGLLEDMTRQERFWLVNTMAPDERADLFAEVEDDDQTRLMALLSDTARREVRQLLQYEPDTAGGLMTTAFVAVSETITCEQATLEVRRAAEHAETIYVVYVLNDDGRLIGVLSLRELILASPETHVSEVMEHSVIWALTDEDQEDVAHRLRTYNLTAIPVITEDEHLVGIVTVDDVLDVIREENTEDSYRMAAITEQPTPYLQTPAWQLARRRVTWLLVLVFAGFISGYVLERYQDVLQLMVLLTFFIPVLTGSGGNAGTQVSTTIIRGLATQEVAPGDVFKVLRKELVVGSVVGSIMGILTAGRVYFLNPDPWLLLTLGLTMMLVVLSAVLIGGILPLFLKRIGLDPALMSSPLITTVTDSLALIIYFETARWLILSH